MRSTRPRDIKTMKNVGFLFPNQNATGTHVNVTGAGILKNAPNPKNAKLFLTEIESAIVMHNTSTQFSDGAEFGLGAEIGISTGKLHARGPVSTQELTTYKYIVKGNGQLRQ